MKPISKRCVFGMALLTLFATNCESSGGHGRNPFEFTVAPTTFFPSEVTSHHGGRHRYAALQFAQTNWSNLTADMAKGQGQYLVTMANLLEVPVAKKPAFYAMTKNKFPLLIPSSETTPTQLLSKLKTETAKL